MKSFLFCWVAMVGMSGLNAQPEFQWAKAIGGQGSDFSSSIARDAAGNVYTTGSFLGTVDFDPGLATFNLTSVGSRDIFICKLDNAGNFMWAKQMGGTGSDEGYGLALDDSGSVCIAGGFTGTADFDPGPSIYNLTSSGIGKNIFVSKLDASGSFIWAKTLTPAATSTSSPTNHLAIAADASGNIYTTGDFVDTVDFDPGSGNYYLVPAGLRDAFISKLDAAGNFVWAKKIGAKTFATGRYLTIDTWGNVYATGDFEGTIDFGSVTDSITSVGQTDIFTSKLDASGNILWARRVGGSGSDNAFCVASDVLGNVYTTGKFSGTSDFDPGTGVFTLSSASGTDIFISKLDSSGNFSWAKNMGGPSDAVGMGITVALSGVYTTGAFLGTVDFDPGTGIYNLNAGTEEHIFLSKLDTTGNFVWAVSIGGSLDDEGTSIVTDTMGNIYSTGFFQGTADFNPGTPIYPLTSSGEADVYVLKLSQSTLPLHLLTFTAKPQNNNVQLNWTSENEQSFDRYEVERSSDGRAFERIQNVKCKMKNGKNAYECIDPVNRQLSSVNTLYYRLKMLDKDGSYTYSKTEKVSFNTQHTTFNIVLRPNPVKEVLQVEVTSEKKASLQVQLLAQDGKVLRSQQWNVNEGTTIQSLNVSALQSGSYFLKLTSLNPPLEGREVEQSVVKFEKL